MFMISASSWEEQASACSAVQQFTTQKILELITASLQALILQWLHNQTIWNISVKFKCTLLNILNPDVCFWRVMWSRSFEDDTHGWYCSSSLSHWVFLLNYKEFKAITDSSIFFKIPKINLKAGKKPSAWTDLKLCRDNSPVDTADMRVHDCTGLSETPVNLLILLLCGEEKNVTRKVMVITNPLCWRVSLNSGKLVSKRLTAVSVFLCCYVNLNNLIS